MFVNIWECGWECDYINKMAESQRGRSKSTSIKTTPMKKNNPSVSMTAEKYMNAKLDFTERKRSTMEKTIESKNNRIREL